MNLKIIAPEKLVYQGKIDKIIVPTQAGVIGILPNHHPLSSIVMPGIVKIVPTDKNQSNFIEGVNFLFENDEIHLVVDRGIIYVDGHNVELLVSSANVSGETDEESLQKMKENLEKQIQEIKLKGDIDEIEKAYLTLQKITADLKLHKYKRRS